MQAVPVSVRRQGTYLSTWLVVWSGAFFVSGRRIPSPFLLNVFTLMMILFIHATHDQRWERFLYSVLIHVLPLVLTLPPRVTWTDAVACSAAVAAYAALVGFFRSNVWAVYQEYCDEIEAA